MTRTTPSRLLQLLQVFPTLFAAILIGPWFAAVQANQPQPAKSTFESTVLGGYAALPALNDLQISPDGQRIAALRPVGQLLGLTIIDLATQRSNIALAADPARYQINFCRWANGIRLVCQVRTIAKLARGGKDEALFQSSVSFAVDHDGSKLVQLSEGGPLLFGEFNRGGFISLLPHDRDHILIPQIDPQAIRALQESVTRQTSRCGPTSGK